MLIHHDTLSPSAVQWTKKQLQPYAKYVVVLAKPALTSMSIAFAAGIYICMEVHVFATSSCPVLCGVNLSVSPHTHHTAKLAARSSMAAMQGAHNTVFSDY